jgi:hypothetical protein
MKKRANGLSTFRLTIAPRDSGDVVPRIKRQ